MAAVYVGRAGKAIVRDAGLVPSVPAWDVDGAVLGIGVRVASFPACVRWSDATDKPQFRHPPGARDHLDR